jgi:hypothetical protein
MRSDLGFRYNAMYYTTVQWIFKVVQMKSARERTYGKGAKEASNFEIAKEFADKECQLPKNQESISETFVANASYIHSYALRHPVIQSAMLRAIERYVHSSPFDSMSKMAQIIRKCKTEPAKVLWCFTMMLDRMQECYISYGELSIANLIGSSTKKGQLDVMLALLDIKDHILYKFLPGLKLDPAVLKARRVRNLTWMARADPSIWLGNLG